MYLQLGLVLLLTIALHISDGNASASGEAVSARADPDFIEKEINGLKREITSYTNEINEAMKKYESNYLRVSAGKTLQQMKDTQETLIRLTEEAQTTILEFLKNGNASLYLYCWSHVLEISQQQWDKSDAVFKCMTMSEKRKKMQNTASNGIKWVQSYLDAGQNCTTQGGSLMDDEEKVKCLRMKRLEAFENHLRWSHETSIELISTSNHLCDLETYEQDYQRFIANEMYSFKKCLKMFKYVHHPLI